MARPAVFDTATVNFARSSESAAAGMVYPALAAPWIATPFRYHW